jgi:hypothetical protein
MGGMSAKKKRNSPMVNDGKMTFTQWNNLNNAFFIIIYFSLYFLLLFYNFPYNTKIFDLSEQKKAQSPALRVNGTKACLSMQKS